MIILPPSMPLRSRSDQSKFVIASIEAAGARVPPSSRLRRMHNLLTADGDIISPDDPEFETALEAERDMQLLAFVFDQLGSSDLDQTCLDLIKKVVGDSTLSQKDKTQSPGRNAAFELFVGAICTSAGLLPVQWEEPDVTCVYSGVKYGFAAKRLKSTSSLIARVRKAVEQISRSGMPGVITLDTCIAFNPSNTRITASLSDIEFMQRYHQAMNILWSRFQSEVQRIISRGNVLGLIAHDFQVHHKPDGHWELAGMTLRIPNLSASASDQRRFNELSMLYTHAMPNQQEVHLAPR